MGFKPILDKVIALIRMNVPQQLGYLNAQNWLLIWLSTWLMEF